MAELPNLFDAPGWQEVSLGAGGVNAAAAPVAVLEPDFLASTYEIRHRWRRGEGLDGLGSVSTFRLNVDERGRLAIGELSVNSPAVSVRIRPQLGDHFDLALLGGSWEGVIDDGSLPGGRWELFTPISLTLLGFNNTDQDDDSRLKHYFQAGLGVGGDVLLQAVGPFGVHLRAQGEARTQNRHRKDAPNYVRHEVLAAGEAQLAWLRDGQAWMFGVFSEIDTQWDPRDADGKSGVDRQVYNVGLRLTFRMVTDEQPEVPETPPDETPPALPALPPDGAV